MEYKISKDDVLLLNHIEQILAEYGETEAANDLDLLKRRINTIIETN